MWFTPCIASFASFVFGVLCYLLSAATSQSQQAQGIDYKIRAFGLIMAGGAVLSVEARLRPVRFERRFGFKKLKTRNYDF